MASSMTDASVPTPVLPFIVVNPRFVEGRCEGKWSKYYYWMSEVCFKKGVFANDTYVFDNCSRKFNIEKVKMVRRTYDVLGLWYRRDQVKVAFEYGPPVQMTFEDIRSEVLEHICQKRWYGQTGADQPLFRKLTMACADMQQLSEHVQFYGKSVRGLR
jgi:hypothetical protein